MRNFSELTSGGGSVLNDLQNTLAVKYQEILEATHNFAVENILGRGFNFDLLKKKTLLFYRRLRYCV